VSSLSFATFAPRLRWASAFPCEPHRRDGHSQLFQSLFAGKIATVLVSVIDPPVVIAAVKTLKPKIEIVL
jgi:hypothetical protein